MEFEYRQTQIDDKSLKNYADLLTKVFPSTSKYTFEFLKWQYATNPCGKVVGYDAFYENKLVAHYVTIPVKYSKNNVQYKGLLSLNTATDPSFQGNGLFTKLAEKTYEVGANNGYQFVIGVANQNSTHGFLKKLGFKLISSLDAYIYLFDSKQSVPSKILFQSIIDDETLKWRVNNPSNKYRFKDDCLYSNTEYSFIKACLSKIKKYPSVSNFSLGFKMVIGVGNEPNTFFKIKIPNKLKPSPLNLIFKKLREFDEEMNSTEIYFELIDFDAY